MKENTFDYGDRRIVIHEQMMTDPFSYPKDGESRAERPQDVKLLLLLLLKSYTKYYTVIIHGDTFHCCDSPIRWRVNVAVPDVQDGDTAATFASGDWRDMQQRDHTIRYDARCYFNVRSKADISQLNLPRGTDN